MICQECGREAPTRYVDFYQNIGMLVMRQHREVKGNLCKDCINSNFWKMTGTTLVLGWWGTISFVFTLFILPNNIIRYLGTLGMPPVPAGAMKPQLNAGTAEKLRPHLQEIFQRLGNKEKLDVVANDISYKAGVSPAQVTLYTIAVAKAAREQQANKPTT
jgi:hypothetical protein